MYYNTINNSPKIKYNLRNRNIVELPLKNKPKINYNINNTKNFNHDITNKHDNENVDNNTLESINDGNLDKLNINKTKVLNNNDFESIGKKIRNNSLDIVDKADLDIMDKVDLDVENNNKNKTDNLNTQNEEIGKNSKVNNLNKIGIGNRMNPTNDKERDKTKDKATRVGQIIQLLEGVEPYDIVEELRNTPANINLAQLLGISSALRADVNRSFKKLKTEEETIIGYAECYDDIENFEIVNNPTHCYCTREVQEHDIAVVSGSVDGYPAAILIDGGSNANLVTRKFLTKFIKNYTVVRTTSGRVHQALSDVEEKVYEIVQLEVQIGTLKINTEFRVVDNGDPIFDIIINLKTQADYKLLVDANSKYLYVRNKINNINGIFSFNVVPLVPLEDVQIFQSQAMFCYIIENPPSTIINNINSINENVDKNKILEVLIDNMDIKDLDFKAEFKKILNSYTDVIAVSSDDLEPSELLPHHIELIAGSKPIKQKAYRISQIQLEALKIELKKLIDKGLIVPSHSPWSSPIVLVPKKNGRWRLCIDYRLLNNITKKDAYAIPIIQEIFDALKDAYIFSTLDLFSGYHQIPMFKDDQELTSFTTKFGNYYFKVMPFGLTNAPATFQREMNRIFFDLINKCVQIYLDDIIVYSPSIEQHLIDLTNVFEILRNNKLKMNIEKCHFCVYEVEALGHKISNKGLLPIERKVDAIKNLDIPTNISELRSFLGMVGYYRNFIENYASISEPLRKLLRKNSPFIWTKEQTISFDNMKNSLCNAPILCYPRFDKPFIIRTDASYLGIGGVLLQLYEDKIEHPVFYISRSLSKSEHNYSITELEGTAAYYCINKFKPYILGNPFRTILYTDHQPLVPIIKNNEPNTSKHARWCLLFSQLQVDVVYQPGRANILADALSRIKRKDIITTNALVNDNNSNTEGNVKENNENNIDDEGNRSENGGNGIVDNNNIIINNNNEEDTPREFIDEIENEKYISEFMKKFLTERIITINDKTYIKDRGKLRLVIDDYLEKIKIIGMAHRIGHEGLQKTYDRIKQNFYWKNMILDIKKYISICKICQLNRSEPSPNLVEQFRTPVEAPFVRLGLDIIGPLKTTSKGNKYIIVCVDYFTLWVEAEASQTITSQDVITFLINVFSRHGLPQIINMDNGTQLNSDFTKIFLDLYGVYIHFVVRYHPASNGLVENRNREIGKQLRNFAGKNNDWDTLLPLALWAIRTSKSSVSGYSSFELLYGREDILPNEINILCSLGESIEQPIEELLLERLIEHTKWIKDAANKKFGTINYWKTRREAKKSMEKIHEYKIGDKVKIRMFQRHKLDPYYIGPYTIKEITWNTVKLQEDKTGIILKRNVHIKNILPYRE